MGLSYSGLFANYFHSPVGTALTGLGSYILYPIIALAGAAETVLSWMHTNIDRRKKDNKLKKETLPAQSQQLFPLLVSLLPSLAR